MTMLPFGQIAPTSRRAVAYVIDAVIAAGLGIVLFGILAVIAAVSGSLEGTLLAFAIGAPVVIALLGVWSLVYVFMQAGTGSIGQRAQGVRVVDAANGDSIGFWRMLLRTVIFALAGSIVVGYFTPLFDGTGRFQGWHDKVAKSVVIDARGIAPLPAPPTQAMPIPSAFDLAGSPAGFDGRSPAVPGSPQAPALPTPGYPQAPAPATPGYPEAPSQPYAAPAPALPVQSQPAPQAPLEPASALDETIVPPRPPLPVTPQPAPAAPEGSDLIAFVPGITQDSPPRPGAAAAPEVPPIPSVEPADEPVIAEAPSAPASVAPASAALEEDDLEQTRISIPGHRLVFTWDDGTRVSVSRRTLFGRNPAAEDGAVLVPVRDETLSLSKTHFEAASETSGGWVMDRSSTNGTTVIRDGVQIECPPGERVAIRLGDVISIGDRIVTVGGYE